MLKNTITPNDGLKRDNPLREKGDVNPSHSISHEGELSDAELETVGGGLKAGARNFLMKSCATGQHIKDGIITH